MFHCGLELCIIFAAGIYKLVFMSTIYYIGPVLKDGNAGIFIRVQNQKPKIDIKKKTGLTVNPRVWDQRNRKGFRDKYKGNTDVERLFAQLDEIRNEVEGQLSLGKELNSEDVQRIVESVVFKEAIEEEQRRLEELERIKADEQKMTLIKYFQKFYDDAESGRRVTVKGTRYTHGSLTSIKQALNHFLEFEGSLKKKHDFGDVNMDFYNDYMTYLNNHDYKLNTIGKNICWLKAVMSMSETEGYHHTAIYKDKRFKDTRVEADSIYLTKQDLDALRNVDLSGEQPGYTLARDIFFIGVWTAQRVSDYNNINEKDIKVNPLLRLLHTPEEVYGMAHDYLVPVILFLFVTMAYNLFAGFLRAVGNSVAPLIFLIISSCLNVGLDILFIVPLGMGVQGAAIATVAAQAVAAVICVFYILRRARQLIPGRKDFVPDKGIYREATFQGLSMSLMNGIIYAGGAILQIGINGMGTLIVAAHTAARRIYSIFLTPFGAINATVSTFVSQNRGADQPDRIRKGVITAYKADVIMTLIIMAILLPGAEMLVRLISGSSEPVVLYNASRYLRFVAPCYIILGILNVTRISLQAIGQKILPVLSSVIELAGKILFAFLAIPRFGYPAVIVCEPLIWCLMVLELMLSFWLNPYIRRKNTCAG